MSAINVTPVLPPFPPATPAVVLPEIARGAGSGYGLAPPGYGLDPYGDPTPGQGVAVRVGP